MKIITTFLATIFCALMLSGCGEAQFDPSDPRAEYGWTVKEYESIVGAIGMGRVKISNKYGNQAGDTYGNSVSARVKGMSYDSALNYVYSSRRETMAQLANYYGH